MIGLYAVVALGGSVLNVRNPDRIREAADLISEALESGLKTCVVVGGGPVAREYINVARDLGAPETALDELGITVTRLNAALLNLALGRPGTDVPETPSEAAETVRREGVAVCGGTHPGHTTDAVGAMIAELLQAPLIIVTNVDGIYDRDPSEPGARKFREISARELERLAFEADLEAGGSFVVDPVATKIIRRGRVTTHVLSWDDFKSAGIRGTLRGRHDGTIVRG